MFNKTKKSRELLDSRKDELITHQNPKSPIAEAYRSIRTNLNFLSPDKNIKSLLVTSSVAREGKSLTLANIAVSMAQNGKKVMIIDADLRKPMQHKFFEMTNYEGLSNILTGELDFKDGLRETDLEGVGIISTGVVPPNPSELLGSTKMDEVLEKAGNEADMLLVDSPPVVPVPDGAVIANKVDGVLLVVASHETDKRLLLKSRESLKRARANLLGVVLNKYPADKDRSYYNYYYYGHNDNLSK